MVIDDLFIRTTTDVSTLKKSVLSDFENLESFNAACIGAGYDMLILFDRGTAFKNAKEEKKYVLNFAGNFENYLNILCQEHSQQYIEKRKNRFMIAWWINHPAHFIDFLKLMNFIDKYINSYFGSWKDTSTQLLTQENCNRSDNIRTVIPALGRLFDFKQIDYVVKSDVKYNITHDFTLFWNNLNQQTELFTQKYYGREIDSIDSFIRLFSIFAAHATILSIERNKKRTTIWDSEDLREYIASEIAEKFKH